MEGRGTGEDVEEKDRWGGARPGTGQALVCCPCRVGPPGSPPPASACAHPANFGTQPASGTYRYYVVACSNQCLVGRSL